MIELDDLLRRASPQPVDATDAIAGFLARADTDGLIDVAYTTVDTPVGPMLAAATENGVVRIAYDTSERVLEQLAQRVSPRLLERRSRLDPLLHQLEEYFEGRRHDFDVRLDRRLLTPFQGRVLAATSAIPFGGTLSYSQVAAAAGSPRAWRATGNALGANPHPIVVPCHRVLAAHGRLGGYGGGVAVKERLLELEGVRVD